MFFNRIAVHMHKFWQIWEKSKNGLKFDIGRLYSQLFNNTLVTWIVSKPHFSDQQNDNNP